jgi:transposase
MPPAWSGCGSLCTLMVLNARSDFHKSTTPLRLWFRAICLMSSTRCGISAKHLERALGVTYKTAWPMLKEIRSMLNDETPFDGEKPVEIDEMFHGGVRKMGTSCRSAQYLPINP